MFFIPFMMFPGFGIVLFVVVVAFFASAPFRKPYDGPDPRLMGRVAYNKALDKYNLEKPQRVAAYKHAKWIERNRVEMENQTRRQQMKMEKHNGRTNSNAILLTITDDQLQNMKTRVKV